MAKFNLVTTSIPEIFSSKKNNLLLGNWCLYQEEKVFLERKNQQIVNYHRDNKEKKINDYYYLEKLYEKILKNLITHLNKFHNVNKSERFWRIFIGPWVWYFIDAVFDRYESLRLAFESFEIEETTIIEHNLSNLFPKSVETIRNYIFDEDYWTHDICSKIIKNFYKNKVKINIHNSDLTKNKIKEFIIKQDTLKKKKKFFLNNLIPFKERQKYVFLSSFLGLKKELILNLKFKQIPFVNSLTLNKTFEVDSSIRKKIKLNFETRNDFEKFILDLLTEQIPTTFLEGFKNLCDEVEKSNMPSKPKYIIGSVFLWYETLNMLFAATKIENYKSKLIYIQHGSEYGTTKIDYADKHEINVSDYFLTWGWNINDNKKVLPIGIVKPIASIKKIDRKKNKKILIILRSTNKFHRLSSTLCGTRDWENYLEDNLQIPLHLDKNIRKELIIRFGPSQKKWECEQWNKQYPDLIKKDLTSCKMIDLLKKTKLAITDNSTSFQELLSADFPVLMLMKFDSTIIKDSIKPIYDDLLNVNILFQDPKILSQHINSIWKNLDEWWNKPDVKNARTNFSKSFANYDPNLTSQIYNFIKNI